MIPEKKFWIYIYIYIYFFFGYADSAIWIIIPSGGCRELEGNIWRKGFCFSVILIKEESDMINRSRQLEIIPR